MDKNLWLIIKDPPLPGLKGLSPVQYILACKKPFYKKLRQSISMKTIDKTAGYRSKTTD